CRSCLVCHQVVFRQQRAQFAQSCGHHFVYSLFCVRRHLLLEMRDTQRILAPDISSVRQSFPGYNTQQCRLTGTIATKETNSLTWLDLKINVGEQWYMAIGQRYVIEAKERHE